ncbi:MAG: hypothetical protein ACLP7W_02570 [Solirubrobacteraceae bacterium]
MTAAAKAPALKAISFVRFCAVVLHLRLTKGQAAIARVAFDGAVPMALEEPARSIAVAAFGPLESIPATARRVVLLRCGRASGKSTLAAAFALYKLVTSDLSMCGPADVPIALCTTPTKPLAKVMVGTARRMVEAAPSLRSLLTASTSDGFTLRRPDGREVSFKAIPKSRGGAAARGVSIVAAVLDESEFLPSEESENSPVQDRDLIGAMMPRLLPSGSLLLTSTPWPVVSATSTLFEANFHAPSGALAARAPTLLMRDHDPLIAALIASERERDEQNAEREFDCAVVAIGSTFFDPARIAAAVSPAPILSSVGTSARSSAGMDLGFRVDPSALAIVQRQNVGGVSKLVVVYLEERRPRPNVPLKPSEVVSDFAREARDRGARTVVADTHYIESAREHAQTAGLFVEEGPAGTRGKLESYVIVRELLREEKLVIPNHPGLIAQMRSVTSRAQPGGGLGIISPRRSGAHGDLLSALVLACWRDNVNFGPIAATYQGPPARTVKGWGDTRCPRY